MFIHCAGEMLVDHYLQAEMHSGGTVIVNSFSICKKVLFPLIQLFGIMLTLVGANLLTSALDPITIQSTISSLNQTIV